MAGEHSDVEQLSRELSEAQHQLTATSEILTALRGSPDDLEGVLGTVVESARRLCRAEVAQLHLAEGPAFVLVRSVGLSAEAVEFMERNPVGRDRESLVGRVGLSKHVEQITDVTVDPDYTRFELQRLSGLRTVLGVPLLLDEEPIGVLVVWRTRVAPFGFREIDVLSAFAAQAAIAIRQVNLRRALERRSEELARRVEQLEALGDLGQAVSASLDPDEVLGTILAHAVLISGTDGGSIFEFDADTESFDLRVTYGTEDPVVEAMHRTRLGLHESLVGRAALEGRLIQVPDTEAEPADGHITVLRNAGWRSSIAVPILRDQRILGVMVVRRRAPGGFPEEMCGVLSTFASQSALAFLNASLYRDLQRQGAELAVASRHKSEFLASMSHELRTPLNAIIGFSEVLLARMFGDINERQEEYLRDIWASGKHLLALLNEILDLSKIEAGRMEIDRKTFAVHDAVEYAQSLVRERAAQHGIAIDVGIEPEVDLIHADELRFKQVVLNLLSNAVKFSPDGGRIEVHAANDGHELTITVADTGPGIAPEDRQRIFESFQQGGRSVAKAEGTGLGLTLSKQLVELHGGRIWVDSVVGKGSSFGFAIPIVAAETVEGVQAVQGAEAVPQPLPLPPTQPPTGVPTIVVVEDDHRSLDLLTLYLEGAGVEIVAARDGQEGLDVIRRIRPAAVVLDLRLPKLDGWDLLALLKADASTAAIPVVVVSMLDERGRGFALGASEYLVKPVGRDEVRAALARVTSLPGIANTVVAIDDDPLALELMQAVLEPEGWAFHRAGSGPEGIELVRQHHPAVVLVDLLMPGMDGFAVVEALRADPATASVPIIVVTSKSMTREDKDRLQGQISYVASKGSFDPAALTSLVRRATMTPAWSTGEPT